ncbi:hypothetical protein UFOVP501_28 [uncultured Caudovirales phage]|uniref:Uncharacterized protein n=1 Tax=uncultured Caudovirales phage TaxID=2100421 RepID=A0A6J5MJS8_9CAUD|nr:hypothetical protein UFOVP501_28 [uncultured Caudovirales phage]CAB4160950.1 hypothetical protein UFOVP762_23 [uncultured Caudovirales phage]CAB4187270.1 hypothetical protein UFOVP1161_28 [uncultured Caudovirales phage]
MTTYSISAPDGKTYEIDGPEGASQDAIRAEVTRQHPHLAAATKSLVDQIPGGENAPPPTVKPTPSLYQRALGVGEVLPGMLGGMVAGVAGPVANVIGNVTSGAFGSPAGVRAGQQLQTRAEQAVGYKPVTQAGAENLQTVGDVLSPLVGVPIPTMNALAGSLGAPARLASNALRGEAELVSGAVGNLVKARSAATQAANEAKSYANAPQIEAAQIGTRLKLAADPSVSNPTASTRVLSALAGPKLSADLSTSNIARVEQLVREDLAAPKGEITLKTINTALDNASKSSYDVVRGLPELRTPPEAIQALNSIPKAALIGGDAAAAAVSTLVDDALGKLGAGRNGALVLDDIRQLRSEALATQKAASIGTSPPKPTEMERAKAQLQIADILESVIDANAPKEVLPALRKGRVRMAQIYDHLRAFDFAGQKFDPSAYVKMYNERQGNMTGLGADIAQFAAVNPAVMTDMAAKGYLLPRIVRGSLGATAGGALGALTANPVGIGAGMAAGIAAERGLGSLITRKMTDPAFQAKYAVPRDYRPNALAPAPPVNTLPVPFVSQGQPAPGQLITRPNWDYYREPQPSGVQVGVPSGAPQLAAPSSEATMANVAQQRAYELARDRAAAAAQEGAAANEPRNSGQQGVLLERDPVTGELRMAPEGGAPTTLASSSLESAISKLSGVPTAETQTKFQRVYAGKDAQGANKYVQRPVAETVTPGENTSRAPTLTATEKIAWDRARSTLDTVLPGFNKLSDAQVTSKMMDRQWVADALKKSREKEAAWAEKANREAITDRQIAEVTDAANRRAALTTLAEALQEQLGKARPVAPKGARQGRVTRAAQRTNQLAPEDAVIVTPQNALIK